MATASGVVAFAGLLDIRGNHVIIDHGLGLASGYSHLSQIHVTRGQSVRAGQIIGVSGNTGRSGGAHLHWEITIAGEWLDAAEFYALWLP
ncbi:M23 family metallopeptidase [bacterium]|nr:M23 family metallopeptidase [bacterium]